MTNPYFTPKTPVSSRNALDIILRTMMGVIAALILGVGIWMAIDSTRGSAVATRTIQTAPGAATETNAGVQGLDDAE